MNFLSLILKKLSGTPLSLSPNALPVEPAPLTWFLNLNTLTFLKKHLNLEVANGVEKMFVYSFNKSKKLTGSFELYSEQIGLQCLGATISSKNLYELILNLDDRHAPMMRSPLPGEVIIHTQKDNSFRTTLSKAGFAQTGYLEHPNHTAHRSTAWQIFTPRWILGVLPVNEKISHFVFSSSQPMKFPSEELENYLHSLPITIKTSPIETTVPREIYSFHRSTYRSSGRLLLADALHQIHPLAGQGLNLGIADLQIALEFFERKKVNYQEIQKELIKRRYIKNALMHQFCKATSMFKGNPALDLGLNLFHSSDLLKYLLFEHYQQCHYGLCDESFKL